MPRRKRSDDIAAAGEVESTLHSTGYKLIQKRLEVAIARKLEDLQQPLNGEETAGVRGELRGMRLALTIPLQLMREGKAGEGAE